ncbi:hypothetical protein ASPZODRAFT_135143 [Penicilliopsis zonata CBS 506.65]|uniref:Protein kinase domain-containing protein n=1 Tax=Penicilliopsis zonata CBS 506.65 TaxID=1073090 RepID=A0A1L9SAY3_9EURO|nr:hypothetical protein ASPZODRAFT_135143 [Penicilliopsis zonata CBS 506.65]OJJ44324.1 hypothetical protein ASPZODRAFT_135143 [Penicilliopsis zonata CBS 506.65]
MADPPTSLWWTEERIKATLCTGFVASHLPPESQRRLLDQPPWGEGLTEETYLDWILTRAGRLFLILNEIGISDRIFALVDESLDDNDLPVAAHSVDRLRLSPHGSSPALDTKFFHAQWRFIVRSINEGDHVRYTQNEGVPIEVQRHGIASPWTQDGVDRVVLAGAVCRVLLRTEVKLGGAPHFFEEAEVLDEVRSLRRLAHEHVFSIYGSYFVDESVSILFAGAYERTLLSFLTDTPQSFKKLPKTQRRALMINWPHCLANGLSWLHAHGQTHGAIRPSNILIDADYKIILGQFEALDTLLPPAKIHDVEAYQYGAPERWVRSATKHETARSNHLLPSGGRTARKQASTSSMMRLSLLKAKDQPPTVDEQSVDESRRPSVASQGTAIRIGFPGSPSRFSFSLSSSSSGSSHDGGRKRGIASIKRPIFYTPSISSSNSSGSAASHPSSSMSRTTSGAAVNPMGSNQASVLVQSWQSHLANPPASDIFSLAAVTLDIITYLCKRKISTFVHHRGAKNRTPGRGGGIADASFHLDRNTSQVASWITLLESDARKGKGPVFRAVGPILATVRQMLQRDSSARPAALLVERQFSNAIRQLDEGVTDLHCISQFPRQIRPDNVDTTTTTTAKQKRPVPPPITVSAPTDPCSTANDTPLSSTTTSSPSILLSGPPSSTSLSLSVSVSASSRSSSPLPSSYASSFGPDASSSSAVTSDLGFDFGFTAWHESGLFDPDDIIAEHYHP